jgi:hypothetical protein
MYEPGTQRERGYMRSISSIWNTNSIGSDADMSRVLMADLKPKAKASSVSSASPVPSDGDGDSDSHGGSDGDSGGDGDGHSGGDGDNGDSKAGRYPKIILGYEINTQDGEHETETQWERWQNRVN